jgi:hypothetical protein
MWRRELTRPRALLTMCNVWSSGVPAMFQGLTTGRFSDSLANPKMHGLPSEKKGHKNNASKIRRTFFLPVCT